MKEKITVLIADDNKDFSQTLAGYLEKQEDMEVIGMAKVGSRGSRNDSKHNTRYSINRYHYATLRWHRSIRENRKIKSTKKTNMYNAFSMLVKIK